MKETKTSYKGKTELKEKTVAMARSHVEQDHLVAGLYYSNGTAEWKGCSVGCFTHDPEGGHDKYPKMFGLPEWLARLQDKIFEGLDQEHRAWWHTSLFEAIPVGANLELCLPKIIYWTLTEGLAGSYDCEKFPDVAKAVDRMVALVKRWSDDDRPTDAEFDEAAEAAEAAFYKRLADATLQILKEAK